MKGLVLDKGETLLDGVLGGVEDSGLLAAVEGVLGGAVDLDLLEVLDEVESV